MAFDPLTAKPVEPIKGFDPTTVRTEPAPLAFDPNTARETTFDPTNISGEVIASPVGEQIKDVPRGLLYGAADAFGGAVEGASRGIGNISRKLAESNENNYNAMAESGMDMEGFRAKSFDVLGKFHRNMEHYWTEYEGTTGLNVDKLDEIRNNMRENFAPESSGFIADVAKGVGGMALLPLDLGPGGILSIPGRMFDEGYQQSTGTEEERLDKATAYAFLASPVELAGDIMLKKFGGRATKRGMTAVAKQAVKKLGLNFISEGGTETLQDGILNKINGKRMFDENSMRTFLVSGTVGTIVSGAHVVNNEVKSSRTRGQLETMGLNDAEITTTMELIAKGKVDEATAFIVEKKNLKMTDVIEASQQAASENTPIDEKQAGQLETLVGKDVLTEKEQADLEMLKMELDVDDQAIIDDAINNVEGSDVVFNELIARLKQEQVQEADNGSERKQTVGAEQEGVAGQEPVTADQTDEGAKPKDAGAAEAKIAEAQARLDEIDQRIKEQGKKQKRKEGTAEENRAQREALMNERAEAQVALEAILKDSAKIRAEAVIADPNSTTNDLSRAWNNIVEWHRRQIKNLNERAREFEDNGDEVKSEELRVEAAQHRLDAEIASVNIAEGRIKDPSQDQQKQIDSAKKRLESAKKDLADARAEQTTQEGKVEGEPVKGEKTGEQATEEKKEAEKKTPDQKLKQIGISRKMRKIVNKQNEIDDTPLPEREKQSELLKNAIEQEIDAGVLIDEIATDPRVLEDIEVASLTIKTAEIVDTIDNLKAELNRTTDENRRSDIELQIGIQLEYLEKIEAGVSASGTKMGRALAAMNMRLIRGTYDIAAVMSKARRSKGAPLTKKDRAKLNKNTDSVNDQQDKIDDMLGDESADILKAKNNKELLEKSKDYLSHLEKVHRELKNQKPKKPKSEQQKQNDQLKALIKQQDIVIDLINQIEGRGKKRPTKKDGKIYDPEGYIAMAKNLREQIRKDGEYKRYLDGERQKEKNLDDKIAETTDNIENVKRTIEKKTEGKKPSIKQQILKKLKGIEKDQDKVIELQNIFNQQIVKVKNKKKLVEDPEGLKQMAQNLRKMIAQSEWYKDAKANPTKVTKRRIATLEAQIANLEEQAKGMYRDIKKGKKIEDPAIEMLKEQIKFMKEEMRIGDELAVVNEDIRLISEGRYSEVDEIKRRNKKVKKVDGLDRERAELQMRKDTLHQSISDLSRNGAGKVVMDAADFLRAMKLSLDTWIGRQGAKTLYSDPKTALSAFKDSMAGSLSDSKFHEASRQIEAMPSTKHGKQHGLEIMEAGGTFDLHQEAMNSKLAEKFPFVRWSNRNMILGINAMRSKMYQKWFNRYPNESQEFYENAAKLINEWTGRGTLGKLEKGAHGLSAIFTAPRWVTSNWQVIANERHAWVKNPKTGKKELDPRLLKEIATQKAKAALGFGMVASMMAAIGFEFEEDPEEGDFMKMRKGDLVVDIMPGLSSNLRLLGVLAESAGARVGAGELEGRMSFSDIADRYLSYKWAPFIGSGRELITGETAIGDEREIEETIVMAMTPIMLESIYQDYVKDGEELKDVMVSQGIQWFGFGGALYEDK